MTRFTVLRLALIVKFITACLGISAPLLNATSSELTASRAHHEAIVGTVLFSVGPASIVPAAQTVETNHSSRGSAVRGDNLKVGDLLVTGAGGHLHVRFNDGAFLAVRPESSLLIEAYRYQDVNPDGATVKFNLIEGVARSITGRAGASAKDRFRLNTPIAAVGIRGTDFVVVTDSEQSSVIVNSGAVVVAPLDQACLAEMLGPCLTPLAQQLTAEMRGLFARIEPSGVRLLPTSEIKPRMPHPDEPTTLASRTNRFRNVDPTQAVQISTPGTLIAGDVSFSVGSSPTQPVGDAFNDRLTKQVTDSYEKVTKSGLNLPASTLVWGRWSTEPIGGETNPAPIITKPEYSRMLVSDGINAIFGPADARSIVPREGKFDFVLRDARASLMTAEGPTAGRVLSGVLSIDFADGFFTTLLRASHDQVDGIILVQGFGPVQRDGLFQSFNPSAQDANIVGVTADAGKEAVYVFSKPVSTRGGTSSSFFGLSRWGR